MLRTPSLRLLGAGALTAGALALAPAAAPAADPPASYKCTSRGTTCFIAFRRQGVLYLQVGTTTRRFATYRLCLRAPKGQLDCRRVTMRRVRGGTYAGRVRWSATFPNRGRGTYRWSTAAGRLTFVV